MRKFAIAAVAALICAPMAAQAGVFLQYGGLLRDPYQYFGWVTMTGKLHQDIAFGQTRQVTAADFEALEISVLWQDFLPPDGHERIYHFTLPGALHTFSATLRGWQDTNVIIDSADPSWPSVTIESDFALPDPNHQGFSQPLRISNQNRMLRLLDDGGRRVWFASMSYVPEPTSWAMMLAGLGMVGAGLRAARRQRGWYNPRCLSR